MSSSTTNACLPLVEGSTLLVVMNNKKYIVLLRGINVGGKNRMKMAELRSLLSTVGFENAKTYIQSGNIILDSDSKPESISHKVKTAIKNHFGYDLQVISFSGEYLAEIEKHCPFDQDPGRTYCIFLDQVIETANLSQLDKLKTDLESYAYHNQVIYLFSPDGYHNSKLDNNRIEKVFGVNATTRNLKTVRKLLELSSD